VSWDDWVLAHRCPRGLLGRNIDVLISPALRDGKISEERFKAPTGRETAAVRLRCPVNRRASSKNSRVFLSRKPGAGFRYVSTRPGF